MSSKTSAIRQAIRYATLCRPVAHCKVNDLEWPWGLFCVKIRFLPAFRESKRLNDKKNNTTSAILLCIVHWSTKRECVIINRSASQPRYMCAADVLFLCGSWASCLTCDTNAACAMATLSLRPSVCLSHSCYKKISVHDFCELYLKFWSAWFRLQ